ncbi:MAG: response regulator [Magnetococcales bacterium]|nr:response regulator [Magnetococcales bacterium]
MSPVHRSQEVHHILGALNGLLGTTLTVVILALLGLGWEIAEIHQEQARTTEETTLLLSISLLLGGLLVLVVWMFAIRITRGVKQQVQAIIEERAHVQALMDGVHDPIIAYDSGGSIQAFNAATERLFGYPTETLYHTDILQLTDQERVEPFLPGQHEKKGCSPPVRVLEMTGVRQDGSRFPMEVTVSAAHPGVLPGSPASWSHIAVVQDCRQRKAAEKKERDYQARITLSTLLRTALEPCSIDEQLQYALDRILEVSWIAIQAKGSIFRMDPANQCLKMVVQRGLSAHLLERCALLPMGQCLCGQAAQSRTTVFVNHLNDDHSIRFPGIADHGHYCIPILSQETLLGVLNLYIPASHLRNPEEEAFLTTVADTLAGLMVRKQVESELLQARQDAEEANRAKGEFLAHMSHEIRTPMNAIIGLGHLLMKTCLTEKQKDYMEKIQFSSHTLLGILNDILDFSKIEANKLQLETVEFSLARILGQVTDLMAGKVQEKGLQLLTVTDPEIPDALLGDPLRLSQVLINLVANAIKFTAQGEIVISVKAGSSDVHSVWLHFSVRDQGIGMTAEQIGRLFQAFGQADHSIARQYGGSGLGLAICERLVGMMQGTIEVESTPGQGSLFTFTACFGRVIDPITGMTALPVLEQLRTLVVDDNAAARHVIQEWLAEFFPGMSVTVATSGEETLEELRRAALAQEQPYGLILLDWHMPGMNGLETATRIKQQDLPHKPPTIILITAFSREEVGMPSEPQVVEALLHKPLSPSALLNTILEVCRREREPAMPPFHEIAAWEETLRKRLRGARVLLVEDNAVNQQVAREILEDLGLRVTVADHGRQAVERVQQKAPFAAIFMDIQMPELNGYQATAALRANPRYHTIPIIAMTADATVGEREKALAAGMNDYLTKPIDLEKLYATLLQWIPPVEAADLPPDPEQPVVATAPDIWLPSVLPGIQTEVALGRVKGNQRLLARLVVQVGESIQEEMAQIREQWAQGDRDAAAKQIHALKGASGNIAATDLYNALLALEKAVRQGEENPTVALCLEHCEKTLLPFLQSVELLRPLLRVEQRKTDHASGPVADLTQAAPLLLALREMLQARDLRARQSMEPLREMLRDADLQPILDPLEEAMHTLDFTQALHILESLTERLGLAGEAP